jgi:hypothetical protein
VGSWRPVEPLGAKGDERIPSWRREVHDDTVTAHVFDRLTKGFTADAVDDEVVVSVEAVADLSGAESPKHVMGTVAVSRQCGDVRPAGGGELDRHPTDTSVRSGDEHSLAEHQAAEPDRMQRGESGRGQGGCACKGDLIRNDGQAIGRYRRILCPGAGSHQSYDALAD